MGQKITDYLWRVWISFDRFCNSILFGDMDHTISYRAAKAWAEGYVSGCVMCRFLDLFDTGHCYNQIKYNDGEAEAEIFRMITEDNKHFWTSFEFRFVFLFFSLVGVIVYCLE